MAIRPRILLLATIFMASLTACDMGPQSGLGFTLPEGDPQQGKQLFSELACNQCHSVAKSDIEQPEEAEFNVALGGTVARIQTYGELVTSIINPSHKFARGSTEAMRTESGDSAMRNYNEVMTVEQLIHLTAFLQEHYELAPYDPTHYRTYP